MSAAQEAGLTAAREIRKNLRSTKGIAMFVLFFLGGAVPSVVQALFVKLIDQTTMMEASAEQQRQFREQVLTRVYNDPATAKYLSACPFVLHWLFRGTLFFLPPLILLIGFDQIAGEVQHRTIRYFAGRARRESIVAGKALGIWAVVSVMVLVLHATVWVVMLARGGGVPPVDVLAWGPRLWLFSCVCAAAYVGLTALLSSLFRTPIVGLFVGAAFFLALLVMNWIFGQFEVTHAVTWAFPATYETLLVSPEPLRFLGGAGGLLGFGVAATAAGAFIVRRRDL